MANYTIKVTTTFTGNGSTEIITTNQGAFLYIIATGTTQSAANAAIEGDLRTYRCYTCAGKSSQEISLVCTATTCYASIVAIRPLCFWVYSQIGRLTANGSNSVSCTCTSISPVNGNKYLRDVYLGILTQDIDCPYALKDKLLDTSKTSYSTSSSDIPQTLAVDKQIETNERIGAYYSPTSPLSLKKCVSLKSLYFNQSNFKTSGVTPAGLLTHYNVMYSIELPPNAGDIGTVEVYISDAPNHYLQAADSYQFNYNPETGEQGGVCDLDITTGELIIYTGVNIDANPRGMTIGVGYKGQTSTFFGATQGEIAIHVEDLGTADQVAITLF